jgi:CMP-N,N'-diacetyllegionaminic acid synthase
VPTHHPFKSFRTDGDFLVPLFGWDDLTKRRQDLPSIAIPNGAIYVARSDLFLSTGSLVLPPVQPYWMSQIDSVDIDTADDLVMAQAILDARKKR